MRKRHVVLLSIGLVMLSSLIQGALITAAGATAENSKSFEEEENAWRAQRDKQMQSPKSWLSIAGLFWLKEGKNSFGSDKSNKIRLPSHSAPAAAGTFIFKKGKVKVVANKKAELLVEEKKIKKMVLKGDDQGEPDVVTLGKLEMWVIKREDQYGIRMRDLEAAPYKNYKGLDFYPPSEKFKIEAEFVPYPESKKVTVTTVIETENEYTSPGYVKFKVDGKEYKLDGFGEVESKRLFILFKDRTNGKETYEPGRFMYAAIKENGKVDLNFNRAFNPPCAYTIWATCPLTPSQNWLKVPIEAGEKKYPDSVH